MLPGTIFAVITRCARACALLLLSECLEPGEYEFELACRPLCTTSRISLSLGKRGGLDRREMVIRFSFSIRPAAIVPSV